MKLYLSSYRIPTPKDLFHLVGKDPKSIDMAVIRNAKDYKTPDEYQEKYDEFVDYCKSLNLTPEFVDLRDFSDEKTLYDYLIGFDLIWGWGGNTFMLLYEMKRSGFDLIIRKLLDNGVVYGGESAGAIVAGASLRGVEFADDPGLTEVVYWDGMKLIDKSIVPHADSTDLDLQQALPLILGQYKDDMDSVIVLNDDEAWVVDGKHARKVNS